MARYSPCSVFGCKEDSDNYSDVFVDTEVSGMKCRVRVHLCEKHLEELRTFTEHTFEFWPRYYLYHPASRTTEELKAACRWGANKIDQLEQDVRRILA